ncbi:MAG TPA: DUF1330 domain-containing protein, partial [Rhodobacter sp.]|nr:DUF1330 domain-containing protein [Rhodobacter sp.]
MPTALWIAHVDVLDVERYQLYAVPAGAVIASFGGVFLARATRAVQLEGEGR